NSAGERKLIFSRRAAGLAESALAIAGKKQLDNPRRSFILSRHGHESAPQSTYPYPIIMGYGLSPGGSTNVGRTAHFPAEPGLPSRLGHETNDRRSHGVAAGIPHGNRDSKGLRRVQDRAKVHGGTLLGHRHHGGRNQALRLSDAGQRPAKRPRLQCFV